MKSLLFDEILLISSRERKARRIKFDRHLTVVQGVGGNRRGKSALLKSLYASLGADPVKIDRKWLRAGVSTLLRITVDGVKYAVHRDSNDFAVFDANDRLLARHHGVHDGLDDFLARVTAFNLKLVSAKGEVITPPPQYIFVPFYMDQDASWKRNWSSFRGLEQIPRWRRDVAEYHLGMRAESFYEHKARRSQLTRELATTQARKAGLRDAYSKVRERYAGLHFNVDFAAYQREVDALLARCTELSRSDEVFKAQLVDIENRRRVLEAQAEIVATVRGEVATSYDFANKAPDTIACPTCGKHYDNTEVRRFNLAHDVDSCDDLMASLQRSISAADRLLARARKKYERNADSLREVNELLDAKRGEVRLEDLIKQEGKKELRLALEESINASVNEELNLWLRIKDLDRIMAAPEDREHRADVSRRFRSAFDDFCEELGVVRESTEEEHGRVDLSISSETGSLVPRALLAYYFAFLDTLSQDLGPVLCPIVVDSPNQQDQTADNVRRILGFIRDHRPKKAQMVLAIAEGHNIEFEGKLVELDRAEGLLTESEYFEVLDELRPFREQLLALF